MVFTEVEKVTVAAIGGLEVMMERCFGCPEDYTTVLPMCQGLENCSNNLGKRG
jgi:hypothetical protein